MSAFGSNEIYAANLIVFSILTMNLQVFCVSPIIAKWIVSPTINYELPLEFFKFIIMFLSIVIIDSTNMITQQSHIHIDNLNVTYQPLTTLKSIGYTYTSWWYWEDVQGCAGEKQFQVWTHPNDTTIDVFYEQHTFAIKYQGPVRRNIMCSMNCYHQQGPFSNVKTQNLDCGLIHFVQNSTLWFQDNHDHLSTSKSTSTSSAPNYLLLPITMFLLNCCGLIIILRNTNTNTTT